MTKKEEPDWERKLRCAVKAQKVRATLAAGLLLGHEFDDSLGIGDACGHRMPPDPKLGYSASLIYCGQPKAAHYDEGDTRCVNVTTY